MNQKGRLLKEWQRILESRGHLVSKATSAKSYQLHTIDRSCISYLWLTAFTQAKTLRFSSTELEGLKKLERLSKRYSLKAFIVVKFAGRPSGYLLSTPEKALKQGQLSRERPSELLIYFYCPACLTQYDLYLSELERAPHCGHCGAALEREG